jgi:hypothetical protein
MGIVFQAFKMYHIHPCRDVEKDGYFGSIYNPAFFRIVNIAPLYRPCNLSVHRGACIIDSIGRKGARNPKFGDINISEVQLKIL